MGCDIHIYREKFTDGRWVSVDTWADAFGEGVDVDYERRAYTDRNYDLFGLLAKGVRREFPCSFQARGMPLQCDARIATAAEGWNGDGHNHSYLYLHELRELNEWASRNVIPVSGMMNATQWEALKASIDAGAPNWELLYPYCQGTSDRSFVNFTIEVPVAFKVGLGLAHIVESLEGIDGENHRIVFWFDN